MNELINILRDILTGALPLVAVPGFLYWLATRRKGSESESE